MSDLMDLMDRDGDGVFSNRGLMALVIVPAIVCGGPCFTALFLKRCVPGVRPKRKISEDALEDEEEEKKQRSFTEPVKHYDPKDLSIAIPPHSNIDPLISQISPLSSTSSSLSPSLNSSSASSSVSISTSLPPSSSSSSSSTATTTTPAPTTTTTTSASSPPMTYVSFASYSSMAQATSPSTSATSAILSTVVAVATDANNISSLHRTSHSSRESFPFSLLPSPSPSPSPSPYSTPQPSPFKTSPSLESVTEEDTYINDNSNRTISDMSAPLLGNSSHSLIDVYDNTIKEEDDDEEDENTNGTNGDKKKSDELTITDNNKTSLKARCYLYWIGIINAIIASKYYVKYIQPVPWSILLGLFEFCADNSNLITSLVVWIDEWKNDPYPLDDRREHVYAFLAIIIVLYVLLEILVIRQLYKHFFGRPENKRNKYLNNLKHHKPKSSCINPYNIKFWLWVWYYPNMCVLAPNAALLKVWFHWTGVAYTIYYLRTHTINGALAGKVFDLLIEIPVSIAQLVIITICFIQLRQIGDVHLKDKEWCKLVKIVYNDWWAPLPRLTTVFLEAKKKKEIAHQNFVKKLRAAKKRSQYVSRENYGTTLVGGSSDSSSGSGSSNNDLGQGE